MLKQYIYYVVATFMTLKGRAQETTTMSEISLGGLVPEEIIPELYEKYLEAVEDDKRQVSWRRLFTNNKEYEIHVQKLKEHNGYKLHNLRIGEKSKLGDTLFYINNPIESKLPNAYLSLGEFKQYLMIRADKNRQLGSQEEKQTIYQHITTHKHHTVSSLKPTTTNATVYLKNVDQNITEYETQPIKYLNETTIKNGTSNEYTSEVTTDSTTVKIVKRTKNLRKKINKTLKPILEKKNMKKAQAKSVKSKLRYNSRKKKTTKFFKSKLRTNTNRNKSYTQRKQKDKGKPLFFTASDNNLNTTMKNTILSSNSIKPKYGKVEKGSLRQGISIKFLNETTISNRSTNEYTSENAMKTTLKQTNNLKKKTNKPLKFIRTNIKRSKAKSVRFKLRTSRNKNKSDTQRKQKDKGNASFFTASDINLNTTMKNITGSSNIKILKYSKVEKGSLRQGVSYEIENTTNNFYQFKSTNRQTIKLINNNNTSNAINNVNATNRISFLNAEKEVSINNYINTQDSAIKLDLNNVNWTKQSPLTLVDNKLGQLVTIIRTVYDTDVTPTHLTEYEVKTTQETVNKSKEPIYETTESYGKSKITPSNTIITSNVAKDKNKLAYKRNGKTVQLDLTAEINMGSDISVELAGVFNGSTMSYMATDNITVISYNSTVQAKYTTVAADDMTVVANENPVVEDNTTVSAGDSTFTSEDVTGLDETTGASYDTTLAADDTTLIADDTTVVLDEVIVTANGTFVAEEDTTVAADDIAVATDDNTVASDKNTAEDITVPADDTTVETDDTTAAADDIDMGTEDTTVVAQGKNEDDDTTTTADDIAVTADDSTVAADDTTVTADDVTIAADDTTVAADDTTVAADDTTVAVDDTTMAADDTTIITEDTEASDDTTVTVEYTTLATDTDVAPDDTTDTPDDAPPASDDTTAAPDDVEEASESTTVSEEPTTEETPELVETTTETTTTEKTTRRTLNRPAVFMGGSWD